MLKWNRGRVGVLLAGCGAFSIAMTQVANAGRPGAASRTVARAFAEPEQRNVVVRWNAIAQNAIVTVAAQPIQRSQLWITLVHVAIHDAVMSINGGYEPFKVRPAVLRPASREAAAVAAVHGVLW